MRGDKRTPRQDKKSSFTPSQKRGDTGSGGGGDKIEKLLAEARERTAAGKYGRAFASLKQILAADPTHQEALRLSATVHLNMGSHVAARAAFDSLVRRSLEQQDFRSAESLLREYLAVGPRYVPFLQLLGDVLERQGNGEVAVTEYGKAIDILLEDQDEEQRSKADELYQKIQQLAPNSSESERLRKVLSPSASDVTTETSTDKPDTSAPSLAGRSAEVPAVEPHLGKRKETPTEKQAQASASSVEPGVEGKPPSPVPWESGKASTTSAPSAKPWEDQAIPAPFPWEMQEPASATESTLESSGGGPIGTDSLTVSSSEASSSVVEAPTPATDEQAPAISEADTSVSTPVTEFRFARESETTGAVQEEEVEKGAAQEPASLEDAVVESPPTPEQEEVVPPTIPIQTEEAVPTTLAAEETRTVESPLETIEEPPVQKQDTVELESGLSTSQEEPTTLPETPEPAIDVVPPLHEAGFKFASDAMSESVGQEAVGDSASLETAPTWETQEETSTTPAAAEASFEAPPLFDPSSVELADAYANEVAEAAEPAVEEKKPGRKAARRARSTSPTWAVPTSSGRPPERKSLATFFPTAAKIQYQLRVLTRKVTTTARSFVMLCVGLAAGTAVLAVLGIIGVSLTWIGIDEQPNSAFHNLSGRPPQGGLGSRDNGYMALRELGLTYSRNPVQVVEGRMVSGATESQDPGWPQGFVEASIAMGRWYAARDPAREFRKQGERVRGWSRALQRPLSQYRRFIGKSVEDLGFGSIEGPDEAYVLGLHRLYLAEGFAAGLRHGVVRLERDIETWRGALAEAKTLRLKMLAAEAINDDLTVASGLLSRSRLNMTFVPTLAKMARPLNHAERSLRWPMQNQFTLEVQMMKDHAKTGGPGNQPIYRKALTYFPLPEQKSMNGHAAYFEALVKHDAGVTIEGDPRKGMPDRYRFARLPAQTLSDYVKNPVDNILVQEPRVDWEETIGRILETEARLRLATLQARLRQQSLARNPVLLIARAGQRFYDPFTGFPMLLNSSKTTLYSVGKDGSDNDGDPANDVSVPLYINKT